MSALDTDPLVQTSPGQTPRADPPGRYPWADPPGRHLPVADTPLGADSPQADAPQADTPWADTHLGADTPQGRHPLCAVHGGRYGQQGGGTHPTEMHTCFRFFCEHLQVYAWPKFCCQITIVVYSTVEKTVLVLLLTATVVGGR